MSFTLPADFKPITLQDIFNAAWQAFIVERRPPAQAPNTHTSGFQTFVCMYKTSDGRRCAVGLTIPEGHPYEKPIMGFLDLVRQERDNIKYCIHDCPPAIFSPELIEMAGEDDVARANSLQIFQARLHDSHAERGCWKTSFSNLEKEYRDIAAEYDLTIPGETK